MNYGQLSKIKISGYKSIKECDLKLNNINVLIGNNGAGKSNFISAFNLLQSVLKKNLQLYTQQTGVNIFQEEFYGWEKSPDSVKFTVASAHEESRWDKVVPNGIDGHVKPILQQNMWRVYHFHDTSRTAKVKQEHNISNNKSLMFDAANLAAFFGKSGSFFI